MLVTRIHFLEDQRGRKYNTKRTVRSTWIDVNAERVYHQAHSNEHCPVKKCYTQIYGNSSTTPEWIIRLSEAKRTIPWSAFWFELSRSKHLRTNVNDWTISTGYVPKLCKTFSLAFRLGTRLQVVYLLFHVITMCLCLQIMSVIYIYFIFMHRI